MAFEVARGTQEVHSLLDNIEEEEAEPSNNGGGQPDEDRDDEPPASPSASEKKKKKEKLACIFKVGDDCRQDVLALQVIGLLKKEFSTAGLGVYVDPYSVVPTGYECGIIEVIPNTKSRAQLGEVTDGGLLEIFRRDHGSPGSPGFEKARKAFVASCAG